MIRLYTGGLILEDQIQGCDLLVKGLREVLLKIETTDLNQKRASISDKNQFAPK